LRSGGSAIDEAIQAQAEEQTVTKAAHTVVEAQISTGSTLQSCRPLAGGQRAVMLVTNRSVNLAMTGLPLKSSLPGLEALIGQPAESPAPGSE
jgi:hypothetical protein